MAFSSSSHDGATETAPTVTVTLDAAERAIAAGAGQGQELGVPMTSAVVDQGGNLVGLRRMNGAWLGSDRHRPKQGVDRRAHDMPTNELAPLAQPRRTHYGQQRSVVVFAGGIALVRTGGSVGAIGVSGGTSSRTRRRPKPVWPLLTLMPVRNPVADGRGKRVSRSW